MAEWGDEPSGSWVAFWGENGELMEERWFSDLEGVPLDFPEGCVSATISGQTQEEFRQQILALNYLLRDAQRAINEHHNAE